jgi:uncharacterized protein
MGYMKGVGASRVTFGTNWPMISHAQCLQRLNALALFWPMISHAQCLQRLNALALTDKGRSDFLSDNARRVFKL